MKRKSSFLTLFLFIGIFTNINPQDVFPTSDAIWNIYLGRQPHFYGLTRDTIINDTIYSKLYLLNDPTLLNDQNDDYIGGFRQEGKKVWFRPDYFTPSYGSSNFEKETLLYDFSKNVGDTIWHNILLFREFELGDSISASIIESVSEDEQGRTILQTTQYIRHIDGTLLYLGGFDTWIEGIGSTDYGLFWFLTPAITGNPYSFFNLGCLKQGNEIIYLDDLYCKSCFDCSFSGNIISNEICRACFVWYETNRILINSELGFLPYEFKLFSLTGQLILEKTLQSDQEEIDFNKQGIWIYQVQRNREILQTGKIIINK